ncbi:MAG TPA: response regulator, partial [Bacteroidales bacterium]
KSILIVEDDEANSLYLNEILSGYDLVIFNAFNGEEALQLINDNPNVDLVLMDIRLPDTNGLILTRLIKVSRPQTVVVAQTAYASHEDVEECLRAGCNDYIAKPINERKLFDLIRHYLESN